MVRLTREMVWMALMPVTSLSRKSVCSRFSSKPVCNLATTMINPFLRRAKFSSTFCSVILLILLAFCLSWLSE